ncbi:MAG: A/G-specific adenine glycosylase [Myxococcales bacterium]|nr:A/G-specific adenine glycosylase [Myxococcales bacterium]
MVSIRQKLLGWYDETARDLPWRQTRDPYAIWVSEVMLQQTRVDTVIPYYERFLASFPTPKDLADADEDAVLSHWSGLGYYRRARLLHAGVREVVAQYGGQVPEDAEARRALPGVGRYTAGAIGSIAFDKEEPIVDGNVTRVLARLFRISTPVGSSVTSKRVWEEAARLVPGARPGVFNQALMELGATVCTPKQPSCESCPVAEHCDARAQGEVDALPVPRVRKAPDQVKLAAVVATQGRGPEARVWLLRSEQSLFAGLWGLPMIPRSAFDLSDARGALRDAGISASLGREPIGQLHHVLTHRRMQIDVFRATGAKAETSETRRLFRTDDLVSVGVSTLTKKLLASALS